ncbi:MAG TPA: DUF2975 domain-containing protein [Opitutaceae bacterium]|nr:DUF2975 domain-containing protein [Opitutaceae bacterium]
MKLFTNLPGSLRFLFGLFRTLSALLAVLWLMALVLGPWIQEWFMDEPKLMVTVGEVLLKVDPATVAIESDSSKPGSLALSSMRGTLQMDLISKDPDLVSAMRWTMFPAMAIFIGFTWVFFGSLSCLCANIQGGEVFSEKNMRLVNRVGVALIAYSIAGMLAGLWGSYVMQEYFTRHITLTDFQAGPGSLGFLVPSGFGALVTGCLVLVVSEAFRQGLALKTDNELTI